jgi:hypothetical protein
MAPTSWKIALHLSIIYKSVPFLRYIRSLSTALDPPMSNILQIKE